MSRHRREPKENRQKIQDMLFKHLQQGMTLKDISIRLGMSTSGAYRYLKEMQEEGIVERTRGWPGHGYKLTNLAIMQDPDNEYIDNE